MQRLLKHQPFQTSLKRPSGVIFIRLVSSGMSSSRGLPPIASRDTTGLRTIRSSIAILVQWSLARTNSSCISCIRVSHIRRRSVGGEGIGVLLVHGVALLLALPELALWGAGSVAVVGGGSEGTLLLAVADEAVLDED
jgi:hypothetical protein